MHDLYSMTKAELLYYIKSIGGCYVIYRPVGGIGDAVMILPAVTEVKKQAGDVPVIVVCVDYIEPIFRHNPAVDVVVSFTEEEISKQQDIRYADALEMAGCVVYRLHHPCPAAIYEAEYCPYIDRSRQEIFAEACDVTFKGDGYNVRLTEEELDIPRTLGLSGRYIVVHLKSHDYWRDYPKLLVKALLYKLVRWGAKYDMQVVSIDSVSHYDIKRVRGIHHTHLNNVFGILNGALLVIGPDSSIVHMAGALGVNTLGIFGPTDPSVRLKYSSAYWMEKFQRCNRQYCWYSPCSKKYCLRTLTPQKIIQKSESILSLSGVL